MEKNQRPVLITHRATGGASDTHVKMPDGSEIPWVYKVEWSHEVGELPKCTIYTRYSEVDIETGADIVAVCPMCKKEIEETVVGAIDHAETEQAGE